MQVIKDLKDYFDHIDVLSKTLRPDKKKELENILSVVLTLLVCMKNSSNLGRFSFEEDLK